MTRLRAIVAKKLIRKANLASFSLLNGIEQIFIKEIVNYSVLYNLVKMGFSKVIYEEGAKDLQKIRKSLPTLKHQKQFSDAISKSL